MSVCISYIQEADDSIESLIDQLGYGTVVATATASVVPPAATVDPEGRGVGAVPNAALSPARAPPNMVAFGPSAANLSEPRSSSRATIMYSIPVPTATSSPVECMRYGSTIHEV